MQILIVDDNEIDVAIMSQALKLSLTMDYNLVSVNCVSKGLRAIDEQNFDVILLDYQMPQTNGIEMIEQIRSKPDLGNCAIIMVSASSDLAIALSCIEAGAQDFLRKQDITQSKLHQAIAHSEKRFEREQKMYADYTQIKSMAVHDPLTGVFNRYYFDETLRSMTQTKDTIHPSIGLLTLDLDNFKYINDSFGHDVGDELLKQVVKRIQTCLRSDDNLARLGGDEFSIIVENIQSATMFGQLAKRIIESFEAPFVINNKQMTTSASIGTAMYPDDAHDSRALIKCADVSMYRAKRHGKNSICCYKPQYKDEFNQQFIVQSKVNKILEHNKFRLVYQPVFGADKTTIVGVEALIRWPNADTCYTPNEFIPIVEDSGQIIEIGRWVMTNAVSQIAQLQRQYNPKLSVAINISQKQLHDQTLCCFMVKTCKQNNVKPASINIEIKESVLNKHDENIIKVLEELVSNGFNIALDDFGLGNCSVSHLTDYPINIVKLDKSMQLKQGDGSKKKTVLEAVILMLKHLNLEVVVKGIETVAQSADCSELAIDKYQGFLFSKPLYSKELVKLLAM